MAVSDRDHYQLVIPKEEMILMRPEPDASPVRHDTHLYRHRCIFCSCHVSFAELRVAWVLCRMAIQCMYHYGVCES